MNTLCVLHLCYICVRDPLIESEFQGVDIAVKTMNLDECARVRVKPDFLFDKFGLRYDNIEARSFFFYTIRLLSIERKAEKSAGGKNLPGAGEKTPEADNVSESGRRYDYYYYYLQIIYKKIYSYNY